ncbi:transglycosylase SLT domain-containing protein [Sphingomonas sp. 1P06PA]|uniref:lytic transglycosylase domain-containing protein n=1 Tax=Sphingomonas sp. 1P06PA TaxID=554121 RepID=UPI0039A5C842
MVKRLVLPSVLLASVATAATLSQQTPIANDPTAPLPGAVLAPPPARAPVAMAATPAYDPLSSAVAEWNRLRQSDSFAFSEYARFLVAHPGWPGEAAMRRAAEKRIDATVAPAQIVSYFAAMPPLGVTGHARHAEALAAMGRTAEAQAAARRAWTTGILSPPDEVLLFGRFGSAFTPQDHDRRMETLLWARATAPAVRQIAYVSPARRPLYDARLALQTGRGEIARFDQDAGYAIDRARWMRDNGQSAAARAYLAGPLRFDAPPTDPAAYLDGLLLHARGAANDNQSTIALGIAQKAALAYPAGTAVRDKPLAERDDYTSLVWLGGITALKKLARPAEAAQLFQDYARAAQTPQTQTKGLYWAGRAAQAAGNSAQGNAWLGEAATHPDQFYGQLSAERLGTTPMLPPDMPVAVDPARRDAFQRQEIVRVARLLGAQRRWQDQSLFIRTIAGSAKTPEEHQLAADLSRSIGRPDLAVMVSRSARAGGHEPMRFGFPTIAVPPAMADNWTMIHAISRQESQFDREATSRVGAKGLMQLMPGTAREQAGKIGLPYDYTRLTSDPQYNVMLGSSFYQRMLSYYGGNHVLAVASYNAGPGNVNKFIRANGDPRLPGVDVLDWIEAIPLSETRGYVQRVLENAVVYDQLNPQGPRMTTRNRLSSYLGRQTAG